MFSSYMIKLKFFTRLIGNLNHGKADNLFAQLKALLEDLCNGVFLYTFVFYVHDSVVDVGVKCVAYVAEDLHTQAGKNIYQLGHSHLYALLVGLILGVFFRILSKSPVMAV